MAVLSRWGILISMPLFSCLMSNLPVMLHTWPELNARIHLSIVDQVTRVAGVGSWSGALINTESLSGAMGVRGE